MPRWVLSRAAPALGLLLVGCSGSHDVLDTKGTGARRIAPVAWFMFIVAGLVVVAVWVLLLHGLLKRRRANGEPDEQRDERWIIAGGIVLPAVVICILTAMSIGVLRAGASADALRVRVTGWQFWWQVDYPEHGITTANEIHIPVNRDVDVTLLAHDVIHSFWVPNLAGKVDMVPGHTNHLTLHATQPGVYRGQCAEFCGLQHANMVFTVIVERAADFDAWAAREAAPAVAPADADAQQGAVAFMQLPCASCHAIRGTSATGTAGPDLTHFASRQTIGAGIVPNNRGYLGGWIADAPATKPGALMPPIPMSPQQLQSLLAYLETLQ